MTTTVSDTSAYAALLAARLVVSDTTAYAALLADRLVVSDTTAYAVLLPSGAQKDTFDTDYWVSQGNVFTNDNLTVTGNAAVFNYSLTASGMSQTREGKRTGKWYVEITLVTASGNNDGIGVVGSAGVGQRFLGDNQGNGIDQGLAYYNNNGLIIKNNSGQASVNNTTYVAGDVIGMAIDLDNKKVWFRKNNGAWIGTSGTPDPATNVGGFDLTSTMSGNQQIFPAVNLSGSSAKFTANYGQTAMTYALPAGFTAGWSYTRTGQFFGTFATHGVGLSNTGFPDQNTVRVSRWVATFTGPITSMLISGVRPWSRIKGVAYDDDGAANPKNLLGVSAMYAGAGLPAGELLINFTGVNVVLGNTYWFGVISDAVSGQAANNQVTCISTSPTRYIYTATDSFASPAAVFPAGSVYPVRIPMMLFGTSGALARRRVMAVIN